MISVSLITCGRTNALQLRPAPTTDTAHCWWSRRRILWSFVLPCAMDDWSTSIRPILRGWLAITLQLDRDHRAHWSVITLRLPVHDASAVSVTQPPASMQKKGVHFAFLWIKIMAMTRRIIENKQLYAAWGDEGSFLWGHAAAAFISLYHGSSCDRAEVEV